MYINGDKREGHETRFVLSLYIPEHDTHFCGATLISPKFGLSAYSCFRIVLGHLKVPLKNITVLTLDPKQVSFYSGHHKSACSYFIRM